MNTFELEELNGKTSDKEVIEKFKTDIAKLRNKLGDISAMDCNCGANEIALDVLEETAPNNKQ